jgi:hypothetical protein
MKRLFTFGCSFTQYGWPTWADILSRQSESYENWGRAGAGNGFIFNSIIECHLRGTFTSDDTVCVMWTNVSREDRYVDNKWVLPGNIYTQSTYDDNFIKQFADTRGYYIRDLALIYSTQQLLKKIGCKYVMLSMVPITNPVQYDSIDISNDIEDLLEYYKSTVSEIRPSVYETVFNNDWCSRPFLPKNTDEVKNLYCTHAGPDWPSWQQFLNKDFKGIKKKILQEIFDKKRWDWESMIKWKQRMDAHPTPCEHLEYVQKVMPEFFIDDETVNWVHEIDRLLWQGKEYKHLWQLSKIKRW